MSNPAAIRALIDAEAAASGFELVGITTPDALPESPGRLKAWLAAGHHADMVWMQDRSEQRADPHALWPEVRSIIMLGLNYGPEHDPRGVLEEPDRGAISVYAQGDDYHDIIKPRLKRIARALVAAAGGGVKVFVDTAPVMEKPLAAAAGLGWQGKHSNLVSRDFGSWLFLGAIYTTLELAPDAAEQNHCGSCRACLDACPTQAFPQPYVVDARRCISYLTIEMKGAIPRPLRPLIGNRIYGCDDCLAACPWNKFAQTAREMKLSARPERIAPDLALLASFDDADFRGFFAKSPVKRIGRDRFLRNVLIAIGNSADLTLVETVRRPLEDHAPLVRGAAVWAHHRLAPNLTKALAADLLPAEMEAEVRAEWAAALEETTECC